MLMRWPRGGGTAGKAFGECCAVGGEEHCPSGFPSGTKRLGEQCHAAVIEPLLRFVKKQNLEGPDQDERQSHRVKLPGGQLVRVPCAEGGQLQFLQDGFDVPGGFTTGFVPGHSHHLQVIQDRQVRRHRRQSEHGRNPGPEAGITFLDGPAAHADHPCGWLAEAGYQLQHGGFAGAVPALHGQSFPGSHGEGDRGQERGAVAHHSRVFKLDHASHCPTPFRGGRHCTSAGRGRHRVSSGVRPRRRRSRPAYRGSPPDAPGRPDACSWCR